MFLFVAANGKRYICFAFLILLARESQWNLKIKCYCDIRTFWISVIFCNMWESLFANGRNLTKANAVQIIRDANRKRLNDSNLSGGAPSIHDIYTATR